ncbi:MAG TPA: hypothetical protein VFF78_00960, partial [Anaerolineaceae bacterium]|nr:hypothetical protein [Anaerolineaceae bacterium]
IWITGLCYEVFLVCYLSGNRIICLWCGDASLAARDGGSIQPDSFSTSDYIYSWVTIDNNPDFSTYNGRNYCACGNNSNANTHTYTYAHTRSN